MNFRKNRREEEPEINLVPMIDILLVVLIFLMVTTTFVKPAALKIRLPGSNNAKTQADNGTTVTIRVNAEGQYAIEGQSQAFALPQLRAFLAERVKNTPNAREKLTVMVEADRNASHQQVVDALDSVAQAGLNRVSIITQKR
jgi:biopolymer transport protein ExbD